MPLFARSVGEEFQSQFENAATRFASIAVIALGSELHYIYSEALGDIFPMSRVAMNQNRFDYLMHTRNPYWRLAMNDLLQDPQGIFFVDGDQFTDTALHVVNYMSEYVPLN